MPKIKNNPHMGEPITFTIASIFLLGFTGLFAWQTWQFVDFLFPSDAILMKILTLLSFDVMLLVYGSLDLFYPFVTSVSHNLIKVGWSVAGLLSIITTILFFSISSMLRFQIVITQSMVNWGYVIVTISVVVNMIILTFWWRIEWVTRHPRSYEYEEIEEEEEPVYSPPRRAIAPVKRTNEVALAQTIAVEEVPFYSLPSTNKTESPKKILPGRKKSDAEVRAEAEHFTRTGETSWKSKSDYRLFVKRRFPDLLAEE